MSSGEHFDQRALRVRLEIIKLILERELRRHTTQERMSGLGYHDVKLAILVVPARTAASKSPNSKSNFRASLTPAVSYMAVDPTVTALTIPPALSVRYTVPFGATAMLAAPLTVK